MISEDSDIWISGSNTISYIICEFLINTILEHNEVDEIKYGNDKQKTIVYQMESQLLENKLQIIIPFFSLSKSILNILLVYKG